MVRTGIFLRVKPEEMEPLHQFYRFLHAGADRYFRMVTGSEYGSLCRFGEMDENSACLPTRNRISVFLYDPLQRFGIAPLECRICLFHQFLSQHLVGLVHRAVRMNLVHDLKV